MNLVRAELRKLRTVRSVRWLVLAVLAYPVLSFLPVLALPAADKADWTADTLLGAVRGQAFVVGLAMLCIGVLATAGEFRHGTIVATLTAAPRRRQVLAAKAAAVLALAAGVAVVVDVLALSLGTAMLRSADVDVSPLNGDALGTAAALFAMALAYGALGVGLGALVRDQTAAIAGALVWATVVENVVPVVLRNPGLAKWMPGGAARSLLTSATPEPDLLAPLAAVVVLVGVTAAMLAGGLAVFAGRDID